jgi:hypothetical protein
MSESQNAIHFGRLRERLLSAGIAPRHVRRTIAELQDHFDDAVRDEQANGYDAETAARLAWRRLGDEDEIVATAAAQPALRSLPARYPRLVFGAGPLLLWLGSVAVTLVLFVGTVEVLRALSLLPPPGTALDPEWLHAPFRAVCFFYVRILPLLIGLALVAAAIRQRLRTPWVVCGAALIAVVSSLSNIHVKFAEHIGEQGSLMLSFAADGAHLPGVLGVALIEFTLIVLTYAMWLRRLQPA